MTLLTAPSVETKEFSWVNGRITGYLSGFIGSLSLLAVLAYLFPAYLTTPELRQVYDASMLQWVLQVAIWVALICGAANWFLNKRKRWGVAGIGFALMAMFLGGAQIPVAAVPSSPFSLGVDWLILAFIISAPIFISLEKLLPKYSEQPILRPKWRTDLSYFVTNHLLITAVLFLGNQCIAQVQEWLGHSGWLFGFREFVQQLPLAVQFVWVLLVADFVLYWEHRIFHEQKSLWPFHAVHHSVEHLDWLAGSRTHLVQTFVERSLVMVALYLTGVDKMVLDLYVGFAAIQAVVIHCNTGLNFGPLKFLLVTPQYHHWHHSSEPEAIDTNYSAHTTLFDRLFKTYHFPVQRWPKKYGTTKPLPGKIWSQFVYPIKALVRK